MTGSRRLLRVGAIAVAHPRANAVGLVRLACAREGLEIELVRVGRFALGFAPVGEAHLVRQRVPYAAVRSLVHEGPVLHLALDPRVATPLSRFALCQFEVGSDEALLHAFRMRAWARVVARALPLLVAIAAAAVLPASLAAGVIGRLAVGLCAGFVAHLACARALAWLSWGGPRSRRIREAFERTLSERLGLVAIAPELVEPAAAPATLPAAMGTVVRPRAFALAALAVAAVLAAGVVLRRYGVVAEVLLPVDEAGRGIAAAVEPLLAEAMKAAEPARPACGCARFDSPLWSEGVPQIALLAAPRRAGVAPFWLRAGRDTPVTFESDAERQDARVDMDLAVVNNGELELDTVSLVVTFARRDAQGVRRNLIERGLHWPGKLPPGGAVKWRVKARGTELKVDHRYDLAIERGDGALAPAPAAAFAALTEAHLGVVRLHGATMLAWLGDARAAATAQGLGGLSPREEAFRQVLLASFTPLRACDAQTDATGASWCVHNGEGELLRSVRVRDANGERAWTIEDLFFPGRGLRVHLDADPPPEQIVVTR